ncbi:tetratricopeptide repeat protein [Pseudacidovorax intermedius]|uniref:Ancillary SecYEG translocon subunit n=1 Tax=Pseudacidovorax intermedius TaxID=433924 RepID=A0A147H1B7_9BURK|nr:tetratricopeptide repeat protein [Pseudacidovorax intermedius]KTT23749.1 membrane protein [Pseudacidovorax intermedius]
MATHLDLEEQEQLDRLKHFWNVYGTLITGLVIVVAVAVLGWNGWQYWQARQSAQAAALYDELDRAVQAGDPAKVERAFDDMKARFAGTVYAQQAGLLASKTLADKDKADASRAALAWVAEKGSDPGYRAVARLRLAAMLMATKSYDEALKQLDGSFPDEFKGLAFDRRGDVLLAQGKRNEAREDYKKAWAALADDAAYRRLVEIKLNAVGVDPRTLTAKATS